MTKCLLVPVDLSEASVRVVQRAGEGASATGAKIELLHVVTRHESLAGSGDVMGELAKLGAPLRATHVTVETHVVSGDPVAEVPHPWRW